MEPLCQARQTRFDMASGTFTYVQKKSKRNCYGSFRTCVSRATQTPFRGLDSTEFVEVARQVYKSISDISFRRCLRGFRECALTALVLTMPMQRKGFDRPQLQSLACDRKFCCHITQGVDYTIKLRSEASRCAPLATAVARQCPIERSLSCLLIP